MAGRTMVLWCGLWGILGGCSGDKGGDADTPGVVVDTGGLSGGDAGDGGTTDTSDTDDTDDSGASDDSGDTEEPVPDPITATIRGTVEVQPYRVVDGVREAVDPADLVGQDFRYGAIFVAAYNDPDGSGTERYHGSDVVAAPEYGPNSFELPVMLDAAGEVYVYASLDENANTIIESIEPVGVWPDEVELVDGAVIEDVVLRIVVNWDAVTGGSSGSGSGGSGGSGSGSGSGSGGSSSDGSGSGDAGSGDSGSGGSGSGSGGSGSGSGTGGTDGCDLVIEGPITLNTTYEGSGLVMLQNPDGTGPVDWTWFDVESGATTSEYFLSTCPDQGQMRLTAAIDSNTNGLIDPADTSGVHVSAPGIDGNPITVGTADLTDMEIELPVVVTSSTGEETVVSGGISLVPFVRLSGEVCHEDGTYDSMPVGSTLLVTALKYRPNTSVSSTSFESDAFDTHTFPWSELTGQACVSYLLYVPANTDLYLWGYGDPDLDGTVNEAGEPVGNGGTTSNGLLQVGTEDIVQDFLLGTL